MAVRGDDDQATDEAAHWLVALDDDPGDLALRARFQAWLDASPANVSAWKHAADIDDLSAKLPPAFEAHWERPRVVADARRLSPRRMLLGGLAATSMACFAFFFAPTVLLRIEADQVTSTGELRSVALDDGSTVRMAPDSAIASDFANGRRRVRLLKGEAFFEVAADPTRPFQVVTGAIETTVLGTAFDVRREERSVAVSVRHGRVRVDNASASPPATEQLEQGQWTRMTLAGAAYRGSVRPDDVAAWMDGQIVARDRALADLVDDLRRYYGGLIVLADDAFGRQRVTGVYNVADPAKALQAVAGAHGGGVRQLGPWVMIVSGP